MATKTKIRITDHPKLRELLDDEYEALSQLELCRYALRLAAHILQLIPDQNWNRAVIQEGFLANEAFQKGNATMHQVRQAGFHIHRAARSCGDPLGQTALRVVGQAVATGHMREHAMVASDYAVKVINLACPDDLDAVKRERLWQLTQMRLIRDGREEASIPSRRPGG